MKNYFILSALASVALYLVISFVAWDLTCITQLPHLDIPGRIIIILIWFIKEMITYLYWSEKVKKKVGDE